MLTELFSVVAPVYACVGVGYVWARSGRPFDTTQVGDLISWVGAPCLVFSRLASLEMTRDAVADIALATLISLCCFGVLGYGILRLAAQPPRTYLAPLIFSNSGNMGLAVTWFAYGSEGLALGVCFFAIASVLHFTVGQWWWSGHASPAVAFSNPLAFAALGGIAAWYFGWTLPLWVERTTGVLGDVTIPLMQITLGVWLGRLHVASLPRALSLSVVRIGMGLTVGVVVAWALALEGSVRGVLIIDCAMPVAVFNSLMAERYGRDPEEVAGLVVVSTFLSFATLPLILAWVL